MINTLKGKPELLILLCEISAMANKNVSSISKARNLEEMAEFWDTHSLADYEDKIYEVEMTFDPSAR